MRFVVKFSGEVFSDRLWQEKGGVGDLGGGVGDAIQNTRCDEFGGGSGAGESGNSGGGDRESVDRTTRKWCNGKPREKLREKNGWQRSRGSASAGDPVDLPGAQPDANYRVIKKKFIERGQLLCFDHSAGLFRFQCG